MKEGIKYFAYYLIIPAFLSIIFNGIVNNNLIFANCIFYLTLLSFFLFIRKKEIYNHFKNFKKNYKKFFIIILKWVSIGFILMCLSNYIISLFIKELPSNEINNRLLILNNPFLSLIYLIIIAPLVEEFVFRYGFRKIKNYYIYIIINGLLFASLHLISITQISHLWYIFPYFFMSLGFSNIYYKCQNYFSSVIGHIIHNTLCVIIILIF